MLFLTLEQCQIRYMQSLLIVIKMRHCCSVTSVGLLTCAYQTRKSLHTLACNSLPWGTVAVIFVAITLIRRKHTDGVVSQTHRLRIKMSSLPKLVMVWENNLKKTPSLSLTALFNFKTTFFSPSETDIKWPFFLDEKTGSLVVKQWYLGTICCI